VGSNGGCFESRRHPDSGLNALGWWLARRRPSSRLGITLSFFAVIWLGVQLAEKLRTEPTPFDANAAHEIQMNAIQGARKDLRTLIERK
jgi:hypothetical protein